jgi:hypothetical protein
LCVAEVLQHADGSHKFRAGTPFFFLSRNRI